jgi:polyisoprenoid-binding protein YceI
MKNMIAMIAVLVFGAMSSNAQNTKWNFDRSHSSIKFSVSHMVVSEADGKFGDFSVNVASDKEDFSDANIDVTIKATSINTDDAKRDEHLRSGDFFDVANHPNITFKSKSMKKSGKGTYKLSGDFTMRGVTKPITLDVKFGGTQKSPWGQTVAGFKITGKINRKDFGVSWSKVLDQGGAVVGDVVDLVANIEITK